MGFVGYYNYRVARFIFCYAPGANRVKLRNSLLNNTPFIGKV